jgi:trehalose-6-phosphate synthase
MADINPPENSGEDQETMDEKEIQEQAIKVRADYQAIERSLAEKRATVQALQSEIEYMEKRILAKKRLKDRLDEWRGNVVPELP